MNGSVHSSPDVVEILLKRGPAGLGFNIVGGVDQEYVMKDSGIYVSKIKEDGAAGLDGRLQEGDKILSINGIVLEDRTHKAVVELFRTAGEDVALLVQKKPPRQMNGPVESNPDSPPPASYWTTILIAALASATIISLLLYRRRN
ncbi:synaptojanin-2-binding protein [Salarias fasciatus]|uniref:Synaptojanin-2-binding protein n=1 Tax=Salarias fasciatus TaxID=181472 RepID=A0A672ILR9_SALFA|nr:synaptojanin-2-binding protein [Salarias fasciatus]